MDRVMKILMMRSPIIRLPANTCSAFSAPTQRADPVATSLGMRPPKCRASPLVRRPQKSRCIFPSDDGTHFHSCVWFFISSCCIQLANSCIVTFFSSASVACRNISCNYGFIQVIHFNVYYFQPSL